MLNLIDIDIEKMEGDMTIEVSYYSLKEDYLLGDETKVSSDVDLRQITKPDKNSLICFETMEGSVKRIFWAHIDKVVHVKNEEENWISDNFRVLEKYLFDNWV